MANDGRILVTPEALEAQANQVRNAAKELQEAFNQMRIRVSETENFWKGEAADAHRKNYNKNQTSIEEIISRYNEHIRDLEEMAGIYRQAETTAKNMADDLPPINL